MEAILFGSIPVNVAIIVKIWLGCSWIGNKTSREIKIIKNDNKAVSIKSHENSFVNKTLVAIPSIIHVTFVDLTKGKCLRSDKFVSIFGSFCPNKSDCNKFSSLLR